MRPHSRRPPSSRRVSTSRTGSPTIRKVWRRTSCGSSQPVRPDARSRTSPARATTPIYEVAEAAARVEAAAYAAHSTPARVVLDRAGRELSARSPRPRRHDRAIAGVPGRGCRRALCARVAGHRRHPRDRGGGRSSRERARPARPSPGRRARGRRCTADLGGRRRSVGSRRRQPSTRRASSSTTARTASGTTWPRPESSKTRFADAFR